MGKSEQFTRMEILLGATAVASVRSYFKVRFVIILWLDRFSGPKEKKYLLPFKWEFIVGIYVHSTEIYPNGILTPDANSGKSRVVLERPAWL